MTAKGKTKIKAKFKMGSDEQMIERMHQSMLEMKGIPKSLRSKLEGIGETIKNSGRGDKNGTKRVI